MGQFPSCELLFRFALLVQCDLNNCKQLVPTSHPNRRDDSVRRSAFVAAGADPAAPIAGGLAAPGPSNLVVYCVRVPSPRSANLGETSNR